jgi:hypothetical protein
MKIQVRINSFSVIVSQSAMILVMMLSFTYSCKNSDENKLVPASDLVTVLTELYLADGLLAIPSIKTEFSKKDSVTNYIDILQRHGLSKTRMDRTMKYYFEKEPKELEKIYDQVLGNLSERETMLTNEKNKAGNVTKNYWTGAQTIAVPESGINYSGDFNIEIKDTGNYIIEFVATVFTDDQSVNPRATACFFYADTSKTGHMDYWNAVSYVKDSQQRSITLSKRNTDPLVTHITGKLLDCDPKSGRWEKHARIDNIFIRKMDLQ